MARYRRWLLAILLGSLAIFPLIGYQVARHGIRPVEEIATTAQHISSTNLHERILPEGYPSEMASLADTFNKMLDRLEESFERISKFSADIAHDLRTPVNNIRGEAEVALVRARTVDEYRDTLGSCLEEAVRLSNLISDLLFLARAENPLTHLHREPVNVAELLDGVRDHYEASAEDSGVSLTTVAGPEPVLAELNRTLVQRALGNLVSNAVAHTPSGGSIVLGTAMETGVEASAETFPIPARAFRRKRCPRSLTVSTGWIRRAPKHPAAPGWDWRSLGAIMLLHGGKVEIASQVGQGTRVTLRIPVSGSR